MATSDTPPPAAVRHLTVDEESDGQRLDNFLVRELKGVPKTHIYRIIRSGEVRRNKGRVAADDRVATGDILRIPPVRVSADGAVAEGGSPWAPPLTGGFTVLELPSREEAIAWAARLAKACRCDQELRVFGFDPAS